jgi:hypothetical protein
MCGDKRSVDRTPRDFLAAWGRGDAGPVPCGACTACCYYPGIVVDERRDSKRLAHLLTERSPEGELVLQRRPDGACVHLGERGCTVYEQRPGPAARVTLLSSGGRRDGAPAADLPPFPDRARRCRSGRTGRSRNTPIRVPTGYSRWRRVQICRGPPSSASSKVTAPYRGGQGQSSLFRRDRQGVWAAFQSSVIANCQSGGILIGSLQSKVAEVLLKTGATWPRL